MKAARLPVAIVGAGVVGPGSRPYPAAYEVALGLAQHGLVIVCGGPTGVMEAACKGAHDAGGIAIGILPTMDLTEANPYAGIVLRPIWAVCATPSANDPTSAAIA